MNMQTRAAQAEQLENDWATNPRWKGVERTYSGADVISILPPFA